MSGSDTNLLPLWASLEVRNFTRRSLAFNERLVNYAALCSDAEKAIEIEWLCNQRSNLAEEASGMRFFLSTTGLDVIQRQLDSELIRLRGCGLHIKVEPPQQHINVLFLDTETTGLGPHDHAVSIGVVLAQAYASTGKILREVVRYHGFMEPKVPISPGAYEVHGLKHSDLAGKQFDIKSLVVMLGVSQLVVAHNKNFDKRMLPFLSTLKQGVWGCSCWEIEWPSEIGGRSLDALCAHFNVDRPSPHNAMNDVTALMAVLEMNRPDGTTYLMDLLRRYGFS